jgi:hypothetical protein
MDDIRGMFALWMKNMSRRSGDFSTKRKKNIPRKTRFNELSKPNFGGR